MKIVFKSTHINIKLTVTILAVIIILILPVIMGAFTSKGHGRATVKEDISFHLENSSIKLENISINDVSVKLYLTKEKKVIDLNLDDYVKGVVAGEMPIKFEEETLKAQAVAARTYVIAHMKKFGGEGCTYNEEADVSDSTDYQVYKSKSDMFKEWSEKDREAYWSKISAAVDETKNEVLTYDGQLVTSPMYFAVSSGRTEDAKAVFGEDKPYLKSVDSLGEEEAPKYKTDTTIKNSEVAYKINSSFPKANLKESNINKQIKILESNDTKSISKIMVGKTTISGPQFRFALGLNSTNISFKFNKDSITFTCIGNGHGVGMSQWGANIMAKNGHNYIDILTHYYNGTKIDKIKQ
ncbi:stage II sporulation protein D [Clostridium sp. 19966]|uniref:stage II sporulation protein D n=1 Tax=Clostridium sp. 19966 TaxID=2768166 RepID=UPI0028DD9C58|nr:stage II sporulation protein D [Clostridium sp. 19966]MDT8715580.1 stage II sporulation protein D [Clostridium sp. 19966]